MVESPPKLLLSLPVNEHFCWQKTTTLRAALKMVVVKWMSSPASVTLSGGATPKCSMDPGWRAEAGQILTPTFWHLSFYKNLLSGRPLFLFVCLFLRC